jgi:hypothetical protein
MNRFIDEALARWTTLPESARLHLAATNALAALLYAEPSIRIRTYLPKLPGIMAYKAMSYPLGFYRGDELVTWFGPQAVRDLAAAILAFDPATPCPPGAQAMPVLSPALERFHAVEREVIAHRQRCGYVLEEELKLCAAYEAARDQLSPAERCQVSIR